MSLLDDLKKEARRVQEENNEGLEAARLEELYQSRFKFPMQSIRSYLSELIEQLKILDHEVRQDYTLPGIGLVKGLRHSDYVVNTDSSDDTKIVRLRFNCVSDSEKEFSVMPKSKADEARDFLESQTIQYAEWPIRDHEQRVIGLNLQLTVTVKVNFVFQVDLDLGAIRLFILNFNGFVVEKSLVQPEKVDEGWLDTLGNYILRNRADLNDLEIDESTRSSIRQRLIESERQRHQELQEALRREQEEREEDFQLSLFGKLKSLTERYKPSG
jgi:hypothetical protein